ncbi:MAG: lipoyl(octanoyl) transferase LipB [Cyanobacteria bacterium REEB459]|nr:lipoyl(octanoyl) transferase LipB [Cyanobacteria bacterium REEB459]
MTPFQAGKPTICEVYSLGLVPYGQAWAGQKQWVEEHRRIPCPDRLVLLEHPPVYTLGQGSNPIHLKAAPEALPYPLFRTERGGEVTHHCPGQLVAYPILNLQRHRPDLHWYLRQLEEVVLGVMATVGVAGHRQAGLTGVWVGDCKLAAIGIKVSRWITMHGFALNVCCDLAGFEAIVPCGIVQRSVGRLSQFCPGLTVEQIRPLVIENFARVFNLTMVYPPAPDWAGQTPWLRTGYTETTEPSPPGDRDSDTLDRAATGPSAAG